MRAEPSPADRLRHAHLREAHASPDAPSAGILDLEELMHQLDGDRGFAEQPLGTFLESAAPPIGQVVEAGDALLQRRAAHQLEGSAASVRAVQLARTAAAIERSQGPPDRDALAQLQPVGQAAEASARMALQRFAAGGRADARRA